MDIPCSLNQLKESGNYRSIPAATVYDGVDFSTNDYLGIASDRSLQLEFMESDDNRMSPLTSSASRLLASRQDEYAALESKLSELYGTPALLFNSGYHANTGLVSSLSDKSTMVLADRLVHASIIDGIVLSRAPFSRFRHNDYNHLESLLKREYNRYNRFLVIVEGVYSMDGDMADISSLVALKRRYPKVTLYVDEAHSIGVSGPSGLGLVERYYRTVPTSERGEVDVVVGTFGKAIGSYGAFCVTSNHIRNFAINTARSFIFSTALPPICCAWTRWILDQMVNMDDRREHLSELSQRLKNVLSGYQSKEATASHIQPLIVGDAVKAVELSRHLAEIGFKVLPIRTPTVPPGTERLRFSLSASMSLDDIDGLGDALKRVVL